MEVTLQGPLGQIALPPSVVTIGTAPDNLVTVHDAKVSPHHAVLRPTEQGYTITDEGSTGGTFINDQQLYPLVPHLLAIGDRIRIGETVFTYEMHEGVAAIQRQGSSPVASAMASESTLATQKPTSIYAVTHPSVKTFADAIPYADWGDVWSKLLWMIFTGCGLLLFSAFIFRPDQQVDFGVFLLATFFLAILGVGFFFASQGLSYLLARAFGGQGKFVEQCYTTLLFALPLFLAFGLLVLVAHWIPLSILAVILIVAGFYVTELQALAFMGVHKLSGFRAIATLFLGSVVIQLIEDSIIPNAPSFFGYIIGSLLYYSIALGILALIVKRTGSLIEN